MKFNLLKKITITIFASILVLSVFGINAMADDTVTITKELTKDENAYAPNTTFEFTVNPGTPVDGGNGAQPILAGPAGGVTVNGRITSAPQASDIGEDELTVGTTTISIDKTKFTAPGIYRYVVKETQGTYEGVVYDASEKFLDVYIGTDGEVLGSAFSTANGKSNGTFTNDYGLNNDTTHDVKITKSVTGNQGDKQKDFEFTVTVTGAAGEKYLMVVTKGGNTTNVELTSGTASTFTLKDGESVQIYGLTATDTVNVVEKDYSTDGYTTTNGNINKSYSADDSTETVTNTRNTTVPTGLFMDFAPYILIVGVALAFFALSRKRISE